MVAPEAPEPLQTLASVRISQTRLEDARSALMRSLEMWENLPPDDAEIPDFPTRVSLARLLMEAVLEEKALSVVERLVQEDDTSVEAWYLGGWCLYLIAQKQEAIRQDGSEQTEVSVDHEYIVRSRKWLLKALKLYGKLEYEDDRLKEHAEELVAELNKTLGEPQEGEEEEEEPSWEDVDEDEVEDEDMQDT